MKDKQDNFLIRITSNQNREFIADGNSCCDVFRLAAGISSLAVPGEAFCLWTQDKTFIAAAILAAICGGPRIIIPYAFSLHALEEARSCVPFSKLLCGLNDLPPADYTVIIPEYAASNTSLDYTGYMADMPRVFLFTGGSTGKPRLLSKTARNLFAEALLLAETFEMGPQDRILSTVPPQHIYGLLFSVLLPLVSGCTVMGDLFSFPQEILFATVAKMPTILVSVPSQYHVLKTDNLKRHNLRLAFSSAGILHKTDAEYFFRKTGLTITDIYGSTETGGIAWKAAPADGQLYRSFKGISWNVHNGRLRLCSDFLSPELPRDQEGYYTTADRAEPCGYDRFILQGRVDNIVKVGGRRVDLAEICEKIKSICGVDDAVVFAIQSLSGRGSDIAALIAGTADASAIRAGLAKLCEPYAIPRHIKNVDSIPVGPTGKVPQAVIENLFRKTEE